MRYDYRCNSCEHADVLTLPMTSSDAPKTCPKCKRRRSFRRLLGLTADICTAAIQYQNRFPYVSTAFPFGGEGAKHVGPMKKLLVESKKQENNLRGLHGYTGE